MPEGPESAIAGQDLATLLNVPFLSDFQSDRFPASPVNPWWGEGRVRLRSITSLGENKILKGSMNPFLGAAPVHITHRGKQLLIAWDSGLLCTLQWGMTAHLSLKEDPKQFPRLHLIFEGLPGVYYELWWCDMRKFSRVTPGTGSWPNLGANPMELTGVELHAILSRYRATVRDLLLDQWLLAGIGNYIVCEVLWHARIHPHVRGRDLSLTQCENIATFTRKVMYDSLACRGTTVVDYEDITGHSGKYQDQLRAYRRKFCCRCGSPIIRLAEGESGHYLCEAEQTLPSATEEPLPGSCPLSLAYDVRPHSSG